MKAITGMASVADPMQMSSCCRCLLSAASGGVGVEAGMQKLIEEGQG